MSKFPALIEMFFVAALGAAIAIIIDLEVSQNGSLLNVMAEYIGLAVVLVSGVRVTWGLTTLILILIGAISVFYLRPLTRKGAFTCGFTTIATLAVFIP